MEHIRLAQGNAFKWLYYFSFDQSSILSVQQLSNHQCSSNFWINRKITRFGQFLSEQQHFFLFCCFFLFRKKTRLPRNQVKPFHLISISDSAGRSIKKENNLDIWPLMHQQCSNKQQRSNLRAWGIWNAFISVAARLWTTQAYIRYQTIILAVGYRRQHQVVLGHRR